MNNLKKAIVGLLLAAMLAVGALVPTAARASEAGRKNTTMALGAVTGYFLLRKQWLPALAAGAGTYYAQKNWQAAINARHRQYGYEYNRSQRRLYGR